VRQCWFYEKSGAERSRRNKVFTLTRVALGPHKVARARHEAFAIVLAEAAIRVQLAGCIVVATTEGATTTVHRFPLFEVTSRSSVSGPDLLRVRSAGVQGVNVQGLQDKGVGGLGE